MDFKCFYATCMTSDPFLVTFDLLLTPFQPFLTLSRAFPGTSCSGHFCGVSAEIVRAVVHRELTQKATSAVNIWDIERAILRQHSRLPIEGHLSAALVGLVAQWREYTTIWRLPVHKRVTAWYCNNFAVFAFCKCSLHLPNSGVSDKVNLTV